MRFNLTPVVRTLLLLNVGIFILQNTQLSFLNYLALYPIGSQSFLPFQPFTYMFLHGSWGHVFSNMIGLFFFGPMLEQVWGSKRFLFFYLFTGVGAGVLQSGITYYETSQMRQSVEAYVARPTPTGFVSYFSEYDSNLRLKFDDFANEFEENSTNPTYVRQSIDLVQRYYQSRLNVPTVGASGAIFGILMAFGLLFPNTEIYLYFLFPVKAKYLVAAYGLYELYAGFQRAPGDSVAHFAHIGGMFFAYILIRYWGAQRNRFY